MSDALWQGYLDEPGHRDERLARVRAAKHGNREAHESLTADFRAWRADWQGRMEALLEPGDR